MSTHSAFQAQRRGKGKQRQEKMISLTMSLIKIRRAQSLVLKMMRRMETKRHLILSRILSLKNL